MRNEPMNGGGKPVTRSRSVVTNLSRQSRLQSRKMVKMTRCCLTLNHRLLNLFYRVRLNTRSVVTNFSPSARTCVSQLHPITSTASDTYALTCLAPVLPMRQLISYRLSSCSHQAAYKHLLIHLTCEPLKPLPRCPFPYTVPP